MTIKTDVAIIGAGCGGTMAAAKLAEQGYTVALFEKERGFGPGLAGVNGLFAVETDVQKEQGYNTTKKQIFDFLMMHNHWGCDARVVSLMVNRSKEVYDFVHERGTNIRSCVITPLGEHTWLFFDDNGARLNKSVGNFFKAQEGCTLYDECEVHSVCRSEEGWRLNIAGKNGPVTAYAKALVIATGEDQEVMPGAVLSEYKGLDMALSQGAEKTMEYENPIDSSGFAPQHMSQPAVLVVNTNGERIMNEENLFNTEDYQRNISLQPGARAVYIINEDVNQFYIKNGYFRQGPFGKEQPSDINDVIDGKASASFGTPPPMEEGEESRPMPEMPADMPPQPKTERFDSLQALADRYGIRYETLRATVDTYNRMAQAGQDDLFFKNPAYMIPMLQDRWYGYEVSYSMKHYAGVIRVNDRMEVISRETRQPIPGLYAVGGIANPVNGPSYTHCCAGSRSTFALVSGMTVAETIPSYLGTV